MNPRTAPQLAGIVQQPLWRRAFCVGGKRLGACWKAKHRWQVPVLRGNAGALAAAHSCGTHLRRQILRVTKMSIPQRSVAVSGRSHCKLCLDLIDSGTDRIGVEAFLAGRMATAWMHPACFFKDVRVERADVRAFLFPLSPTLLGTSRLPCVSLVPSFPGARRALMDSVWLPSRRRTGASAGSLSRPA